MAYARGDDVTAKHAAKKVDRLLSNGAVDLWRLFSAWAPFALAERK